MTQPFSEFVTIGDIADVKGGKRLPKGMVIQNETTSHAYLRVVDFKDDVIDRSNIKYIDDDAFAKVKRYTISSDDVYISIAGTIGRVGVIPKDLSGANLTENAAKITNISGDIDNIFLMYYLRSHLGQSDITSKVVGTSQPKLALFRIQELRVPKVPLPTQHKIAAILSAYDVLIENNLRRIKILEEMAQNLYREWFVKFRFPGHEKVHLIDSSLGKIPETWGVVKLAKAIELAYGKALKKGDRKRGDNPVYGSSGLVGYHNEALVIGPGIIVGRKGNVGSVHWSDSDFYPIDTVFYVKSNLSLFYVFYNLKNQNFINSDAAVPGLSRKQAYSLPFLIPQKFVLDMFSQHVEVIFAQILNLNRKIHVFRQTRDLLLPKLISGELDVSELGIDIGNLTVQAGAESPAIRSADTTAKKKVKIETAPLPQPKKESSVKTPEPKTSDKIPAPINEWETNEVMAVFRSFARGKGFIEREQFIRLVAHEMGYKRVSSRIYSTLKGHVIAAIRRDILETENGWVRIKTSTIEQYHPNDLIRALWSVLPKNRYSSREDTMRAAAEHLGFRRLTEKARMNIKAAMRVAIRKGILKGDKEDIWRAD